MSFSAELIHRSALKNAPYNPRTITTKARKKLQANLSKYGLIEPPIWNKRTGHIVGGHQRVSVLDTLEGTPDYMLPVAVVDLDLKAEKVQNLFLNNAEAQGDWDLDKMEVMLKEIGDWNDAGFDTADVYQMFGDSVAIDQSERLEELAAQIRESQEKYEKITKANNKRDDVNFYLVVVFKDYDARKAFTDSQGWPDNRFVDGRQLQELLTNGAE